MRSPVGGGLATEASPNLCGTSLITVPVRGRVPYVGPQGGRGGDPPAGDGNEVPAQILWRSCDLRIMIIKVTVEVAVIATTSTVSLLIKVAHRWDHHKICARTD